MRLRRSDRMAPNHHAFPGPCANVAKTSVAIPAELSLVIVN